MARTKKLPKISILNWMGTLLLCAIPGVNIIFLLLTLFLAKSPSKKTFAGAALIWVLILILLAAAALILLPTQITDLTATLRDLAATTPAPTIAPIA